MNQDESKRTDWMLEGGEDLPIPTHPHEVLRARQKELEENNRILSELENIERRERTAVSIFVWVVGGGTSLIVAYSIGKWLIRIITLALFFSCSRPVCDYKRLYKGSHSPRPKIHINSKPVPRGSILGILKHKN